MSLFAPFPFTSTGGSSGPSPDVAPLELTYTPGFAAVRPWQKETYFRGAGILVCWTPDNNNPVDPNDYEARAGVPGTGVYDTYTILNGKLSFDSGTRKLYMNPTVAESAAWPLVGMLFVLARIDDDNNRCPEGLAIIDVVDNLWP